LGNYRSYVVVKFDEQKNSVVCIDDAGNIRNIFKIGFPKDIKEGDIFKPSTAAEGDRFVIIKNVSNVDSNSDEYTFRDMKRKYEAYKKYENS